MYPIGGIPDVRGGYPNPIYSNSPIISTQSILQDMDLSYLLYTIPPRRGILWTGYLPGGVRSGPAELETAGYQLGGISYRELLAGGFGANSYAVR